MKKTLAFDFRSGLFRFSVGFGGHYPLNLSDRILKILLLGYLAIHLGACGGQATGDDLFAAPKQPVGGNPGEGGPGGDNNPTLTFSSLTSSSFINAAEEGGFVVAGTCSEEGRSVDVTLGSSTQSVNCSSGQFSVTFDASSLGEGSVALAATTENEGGEQGSIGFSITKDTVAPSVTGLSNDGNATQAKNWSWGCSESNCQFRNTVDQSAATNPGGSFGSSTSDSQSSGDGTFFNHVQASDAAGNPSAVVHVSALLDNTAPGDLSGFIMLSPASSPNNDPDITLRASGTVSGDTLKIYSDASCATEVDSVVAAGSDTDSNITIASDGTTTYFAAVEDSAGNKSACTSPAISYALDRSVNVPNAITLVSPASSPGNDSTPTVRVGGIETGDNIKLYTTSDCFAASEIGFAQATGTTVDITVSSSAFTSDGTYTVFARADDAAGNLSACSSASLSYELDTVAPSAPSSITRTEPVGSPGTDDTPTYSVAGLGVGDTVKVYTDASCAQEVGSETVAGDPTNVTTNALGSDGSYTFFTTATDPAGNASGCAGPSAAYVLDQSAPTLTSVSIASSGGGAEVGLGGEVVLTFTASEPLQTTTVTIMGNAATVTLISGSTYEARHTVGGGDPAGAVAFTVDFSDAGGNNGTQVTATTDGSSLSADPVDNSPVLNIAAQTGDENSLFSLDVNDQNSGNDTDADGDTITYNCVFDSTVDGQVAGSTACTTISGLTFATATGVISWTPDFTQSGAYEIKIIADEGNLEFGEVFTLTINNTNRAPELTTISNFEVLLDDDINFEVNDVNTNNDTDLDGETITYSCVYDDLQDGSVTATDLCSEIAGLSFNETNGQFNWAIKASNVGNYEMKIVGSDGTDTGEELFLVDVLVDVSKLEQFSMVGTGETADVASLGDNNVITLNGNPITAPGGGNYGLGDIFQVTTSAGDVLSCTEGCFAITPIDGTAAWSSEANAGTLLSTYMGRSTDAKIAVVAFDNPATITINQSSGVLASATIPANTVQEFEVTYAIEALWIESNADISAYISSEQTSGSGVFDRDGRVMTAAAKQSLGFVSGGGGTPSGISTTADNTIVDVYRNDGTNFNDTDLDIIEVLDVTSSTSQNPGAAAISIFSDKPVVSTQHADGDGNNATPSLPKSMLPNHFVIPVTGDYVSIASFDEGEVRVIDTSGNITSRLIMTRDPGAHANAPYAISHNPASIPAGTRFACTTPCLGILEPDSSDDETLMTGTIRDPFSLSSTDFVNGGTLSNNFTDNIGGQCDGDNDFPNLTWEDVPWGTQSFVVIVEDTSDSDFVHLNLFDIAATESGIDFIDAVNEVVTFPSGTVGQNGNGNASYEGPCPSSGTHSYRIKVYALDSTLGASLDNTTTTAFEAAHASKILSSAEMTVNAD